MTILAQFSGGAGIPFRELALVGVVAALVTYLATSVIRGVAPKLGAVAAIRERDVHVVPTPRLGGIGLYTGVVAGVFLAAQLPALTRGFPPLAPDVFATMIAASIIVVVGAIDDLFGLEAMTKLAGQSVAAGALALWGLSWVIVYIPINGVGLLILDDLQAGALTIFITLAVVNAMNFVDGLDGLAAGLGAITALAICAYSIGILHSQGGTVSAYPPALLTAILAGACLGFLPHNFQPARIFLGDSGSMLIGLMLAAACTSASGRISPSLFGTQDMIALLSPIFVVAAAMFVPMLDLLLAVIRRVRAGRSPFAADKMHLHHRLLDMGHSHRHVALVIYAWVALLAFGAVGTTFVPTQILLPSVAAAFLVVLAFTLVPRLKAQRRRSDQPSEAKSIEPPSLEFPL